MTKPTVRTTIYRLLWLAAVTVSVAASYSYVLADVCSTAGGTGC